MFDLRYHVASLAAVFVSLAVGIVIGVAIASGGEVERQTADLLEQNRDALRAELDETEALLEQARLAGQADGELVDALYLPIVQGRLVGDRIALVQLGDADSPAAGEVEDVLRTGGATGPSLALELPLDLTEVDAALAADPATAAYAGEENRDALGEALGEELATVGAGPFWTALQGVIVSQASGVAPDLLDGAAVVRTWNPATDDPEAPESPEVVQTESFLQGLLRGLASPGIPVVGAERLGDVPSTVTFFQEVDGVSSVDDVGRAAGDISLALLLSGAPAGHYGAKDTAVDGVVPALPSLVPATGVG